MSKDTTLELISFVEDCELVDVGSDGMKNSCWLLGFFELQKNFVMDTTS